MLSYEESLKILKETKALIDGHFILSSGLHSPRYVQCAQLLSKPKKASQICNSLAEKIKSSFEDFDFSILTPEIYKTNDNVWKKLAKSEFRRNYHSSSLLLPDGRIFVGGGDVWNAQFYYPPYLFSKNSKGKTILAKRPEITEINKVINDRNNQSIKVDDNSVIEKISLINGFLIGGASQKSKNFIDIIKKSAN